MYDKEQIDAEKISDKLDKIFSKLDKIDEIDKRLDKIEERMDQIERSTGNMDSHINFVENLYDVVKLPFSNMLHALSWTGSWGKINNDDDNGPKRICLPEMEKRSTKDDKAF